VRHRRPARLLREAGSTRQRRGGRLARQVADAGVEIQIGYPCRFDPAFAAARATVANGDGYAPRTQARSGPGLSRYSTLPG